MRLPAPLNFFNTKSPSSSFTKQQRTQVRQWAAKLDRYNNGLLGPEHCDDDGFATGRELGAVRPAIFLPLVNP